jgi:hypothetical protein
MSVYIYRVEDENGEGCYSAHLPELERMYNKHANIGLPVYPQPIDDVGIQMNPEPDEICGFKDKVQALSWFSKYELRRMKKFGFELKKVEVEAITAIGERQVLAVRQRQNVI